MLARNELLSGYRPREATSSKNGRFELLLGRTGIFLHLLEVRDKVPWDPSGAPAQKQDGSFSGQLSLAQPTTTWSLASCYPPRELLSLQAQPNPEPFVSSQCAETHLFTQGRNWCHHLQICNISGRIHEPVATAGHKYSSQKLASKNRVWPGFGVGVTWIYFPQDCTGTASIVNYIKLVNTQ